MNLKLRHGVPHNKDKPDDFRKKSIFLITQQEGKKSRNFEGIRNVNSREECVSPLSGEILFPKNVNRFFSIFFHPLQNPLPIVFLLGPWLQEEDGFGLLQKSLFNLQASPTLPLSLIMEQMRSTPWNINVNITEPVLDAHRFQLQVEERNKKKGWMRMKNLSDPV
ncbi:hypothetical protein CEXT_500191 [Caerostris extrusa]|uniref:Uncharacterized protein n=1 Tax=Caerostris extrusa TaxID=172846 RepID=A0AAV4WRA0_CAEEX|nr:hypothetical protein CEXT_500191 [Caerostris extrusa]